nr:unnamed protein product [Callosobruchus chinensis]
MCESRLLTKILNWKPPFRQKSGRPPEDWEKTIEK